MELLKMSSIKLYRNQCEEETKINFTFIALWNDVHLLISTLSNAFIHLYMSALYYIFTDYIRLTQIEQLDV